MTSEKKIIIEAHSVDAALSDVSRQWQVPVENLKAEIISEERKGFLGLGGKILKVEISLLQSTDSDLDTSVKVKSEKEEGQEILDSEPENNEPEEDSNSATNSSRSKLLAKGAKFVNETLKLMDFKAEAVISESMKNTLNIQGEDAQDYVVGRYGDALKGMEYLVNLSLRDPKSEPRIKIDSCGYRERRTKSLERLAEATARQASKYGRPVRLEPMASWERWVIHTTLQDRDDVSTESVGEAPFRKVVIMPKFNPEQETVAGPATMRLRARRESVGHSPVQERRPIERDRRRR
ncbi:MAG: Jag N-terminal domain-containing protein, partial [Synergistaceae bacterium]|nr:Jag N-terminal domain-containing protein [Synergistaceae bacterium]